VVNVKKKALKQACILILSSERCMEEATSKIWSQMVGYIKTDLVSGLMWIRVGDTGGGGAIVNFVINVLIS
jgi:hypothetical protein